MSNLYRFLSTFVLCVSLLLAGVFAGKASGQSSVSVGVGSAFGLMDTLKSPVSAEIEDAFWQNYDSSIFLNYEFLEGYKLHFGLSLLNYGYWNTSLGDVNHYLAPHLITGLSGKFSEEFYVQGNLSYGQVVHNFLHALELYDGYEVWDMATGVKRVELLLGWQFYEDLALQAGLGYAMYSVYMYSLSAVNEDGFLEGSASKDVDDLLTLSVPYLALGVQWSVYDW